MFVELLFHPLLLHHQANQTKPSNNPYISYFIIVSELVNQTFITMNYEFKFKQTKYIQNIARGTTDPEIDSETWTKLGNNMAPLALIANLATRWRHMTFSHLITFSHQITFSH